MVDCDEIKSSKTVELLCQDGWVLSDIYPYYQADGELVYVRIRITHPTKDKHIRPLYKNQYGSYILSEPDSIKKGKKLLYGLLLLHQFPNAHAWIVEGEKCVNALNDFFTRHNVQENYIAITSGGATSAEKADWEPVRGRKVTIWQDNDEPGSSYAYAVNEQLHSLDCMIDRIDVTATKLAEHEDCVDWLALNCDATIETLLSLARDAFYPSHNLNIQCAADIQMKPLRWLWEGLIPLGKLTVIAGQPGLGKSQITAKLAAHITSGIPWPNGAHPRELGSVIIMSAEDDPEDTIVPRLVAAGADLQKCLIVKGTNAIEKKKTIQHMFDLTKDVGELEQYIIGRKDVKLVIIDPIVVYLGKTDSHNNAEIRNALTPISELAAKYGVAIVAVTHFNKSTEQDMINRITGSIGFPAAARAVFAVLKDNKNPAIRYFIPLKNNNGDDRSGFEFTARTVDLGNGISTSCIEWKEGAIDGHDILLEASDTQPKKARPSKLKLAMDFLSTTFSGQTVLQKEVLKQALKAGHTEGTIRKAATFLNVLIEKQKIRNGQSEWTFPILEPSEDGEDGEDFEDDHDSNLPLFANQPEEQ